METRKIQMITLLIALTSSAQSYGQNYRLPIGDCGENSPCYPTAYMYHNGKDWNCGNKTYKRQLKGGTWYYHKGTDIAIGRFAQMDIGRTVVAAADGVVSEWLDICEEDRCEGGCCKCTKNKTKNGLGNYVKIKHADGKITLYGHLKTGSIPDDIVVGNPVKCGQKIGEVGSSGCSTAPHLHFEVRLANGNADDPFSGECGGPLSYWNSQGDYNKLPSENCTPATPCKTPVLSLPSNGDINVSVNGSGVIWWPTFCGLLKLADLYRVQVHTNSVFPLDCDTKQADCEKLIVVNKGFQNLTVSYQFPPNLLAYDTAYYWRVRAGHTSGAGGNWSEVWKFTTEKRQFACVPSPEICDGKDNDCDGDTDEGCGQCANGETRSCFDGKIGMWGVGICKAGMETCRNGTFGPCVGQILPSTEICDNADNDCDGKKDEGLSRTCSNGCGNGTETCQDGNWINCNAPVPNSCGSCTGSRKCATACGTGTEQCSNGQWVKCTAPPENSCGTCSATRPCMEACGEGTETCVAGQWVNCTGKSLNSCGSCNNTRQCATACGIGTETCSAGKWVSCTARLPSPETCNNIDDDCNGKIDENLTRSCLTICGNGTETCQDGNWINCNAPVPNSCGSCTGSRKCATACGTGTEQCSNGQWVKCTAPPENSCGSCNNTRQCATACGIGTETCSAGKWVNCTARLPSSETCNNADDDCNGKIDDGLVQACTNGCNNGTQTCTAGIWSACDAPACQQPLVAPVLLNPPNGLIITIQDGDSGNQILQWGAVIETSSYEYEIRYYTADRSGHLIEFGRTQALSHTFSFNPSAHYGRGIEWRVRGVKFDGAIGPWSERSNNFFIHPLDSFVACLDGNCPSPGTIYMVTTNLINGYQGTPSRFVLEWADVHCWGGNLGARVIPGTHILNYYRSTAKGGCP